MALVFPQISWDYMWGFAHQSWRIPDLKDKESR